MDKLSRLLMVAGRKAPRYQQMALLYPRSADLKSSMSEYFTVIVHLCQKLYKATQKSTLGSYFAFLGDLDLKEHETNLQLWADCIKDEVTLLTARNVNEQAIILSSLSKSSEYGTHWRRLQNRLQALDACSTYDHEATWKEIRKCGNSTLLAQLDQYSEWKTETTSSTLLCTGKLGFGKSVLLANMVAELNLSDIPVVYFFCRHDIPESLKARTIIGCLARQLIGIIMNQAPDVAFAVSSEMGLEDLLKLVVRMIPSTTRAYLVLDGLNECGDHEREMTLIYLEQLQERCNLKICCSFRSDAHLQSVWNSAERLISSRVCQLPEDNPDISRFVTSELERCIESGRLSVGDPTLVSDIEKALVNRAQGMFLWVILQIASLCTAQTDEEIREALENLPKGLPETFSRILEKSQKTGKKYQHLIFKLCMAARRPLTTEELREALSVSKYDTDWMPERTVNNVFAVLSTCGSLITVDEENLTVRFLHHSVKQFLLEDFDHENKPRLTLKDADRTMGETIITYLNYNMFETALSTTAVPEMMAQDLPSGIVESTLRHSTHVRTAALKMLKRRQSYRHDLRDTLLRTRKVSRQKGQFKFHAYAEAFWLCHLGWIFDQEPTALSLLFRLLEKKRVRINQEGDDGETLLWKAVGSDSIEVVGQLLGYGANINIDRKNSYTLLHLAATKCGADMVEKMLDHGAQIEAKTAHGMTPLLLATKHGNRAAVERLLFCGARIDTKDEDDCSSIVLAASQGDQPIVEVFVSRLKDTVDFEKKDGRTAAWLAAYRGHQAVLEYLIESGVNLKAKDADGWVPLLLAAGAGHTAVIQSLLKHGIDLEATDNDGWTALFWAVYKGQNYVVQYLLSQNASMETQDKDGWTPLLLAVAQDYEAIVQSLVDCGANVCASTHDGRSALEIATDRGSQTIKQLLLDRGAILQAESRIGDSQTSAGDQSHEKYRAGDSGGSNGRRVVDGSDQAFDGSAGESDNKKAEKVADRRVEVTAHSKYSDAELEIDTECNEIPLLRWTAGGSLSALKFWRLQGASIRTKSSTGRTALHLAAERGNLDVVQFLQNAGAVVGDRMEDGRTALHMAAARGHVEVVKYLLDNGAVLGTRAADGRSALSFAVEHGHNNVVTHLLGRGASMNDL